MDDRLVRTSKFLSYVLRHNPDAVGLTLAPGGWADVDALIDRARAEGHSLSRPRIKHVIAAGDKRRFTLSEDESMIRANYGHSIDVDLDLEPTAPPNRLYHGTAKRALPSIREDGLQPQSRQYVHLSSTQEEATAVGRRHGEPVVITVNAQALDEDGHTLYRSTDAVWLTPRVPARYLEFPSD